MAHRSLLLDDWLENLPPFNYDLLRWHTSHDFIEPITAELQAPLSLNKRIAASKNKTIANPIAAAVTATTAKIGTITQEVSQGSDIYKGLQQITELAGLKAFYQQFPFEIRHLARNLVFSRGSPAQRFMLIGEAPGQEEDRQGHPFVGMSGKLLDKMLSFCGWSPEEVYIANVIPWRPPNNRAPTTQEINHFLPLLHQHIKLVRPLVIVLLGGTSTKALLNLEEGIVRIRGKIYRLRFADSQATFEVDVLPTFHPAYLLRSPLQKALAFKDLLAARLLWEQKLA